MMDDGCWILDAGCWTLALSLEDDAKPSPCRSACFGEHRYFLFKTASEPFLLDFQIVPGLQVKPEALGSAEISREPKSGVSRNRPLAVGDLVDAAGGHADLLCQPVLADLHGFQELFKQDFTGTNRREIFGSHYSLLVIIRDLHIVGVPPAPLEVDAPLIINPNAVLAFTVPLLFMNVYPWKISPILAGFPFSLASPVYRVTFSFYLFFFFPEYYKNIIFYY